MIQSACDPGAPQKLTIQAIRGRVCIVCGRAPAALPAKGVIPAKAVKPAIPATPSISRRVKRGCDSIISLIGNESAISVCFFAIMFRPRLPSVRQRKLVCSDPRIGGKLANRRTTAGFACSYYSAKNAYVKHISDARQLNDFEIAIDVLVGVLSHSHSSLSFLSRRPLHASRHTRHSALEDHKESIGAVERTPEGCKEISQG